VRRGGCGWRVRQGGGCGRGAGAVGTAHYSRLINLRFSLRDLLSHHLPNKCACTWVRELQCVAHSHHLPNT